MIIEQKFTTPNLSYLDFNPHALLLSSPLFKKSFVLILKWVSIMGNFQSAQKDLCKAIGLRVKNCDI